MMKQSTMNGDPPLSNSKRVDQAAAAEKEKAKGNDYFKEKKYLDAIRCYSNAIKLNPNSATYYNNRAAAYFELEKFIETEHDCTAALKLDENYVKCYRRRGMARKRLYRLDGAASDFQKVLKLDPKDKVAVSELKEVESMLESNEPISIKPHNIPPEYRSTKPFRHIQVTRSQKSSSPSSMKPNGCDKKVSAAGRSPNSVSSSKSVNIPPPPITNRTLFTAMFKRIPNTALDLESDWQLLRSDPSNSIPFKVLYLTNCGVNHMLSLLRFTGIEPDFLIDIIHCLVSYLEKPDHTALLNGDLIAPTAEQVIHFAFNFLSNLNSIPRASMILMMLSNDDRQLLTNLFRIMSAISSIAQDEIVSLALKYDINI